MLITTGYNFEGYDIVKYLDVLSASVVIGTGMLSSANASVADFFGTRSNSYERKLQDAKNAAINELKNQTSSRGGNAIIGIDIDYTTFGADIIGVIANGTAVKIKESEEKTNYIPYAVPSMVRNEMLPINVCNVNLKYNPVDEITLSAICIKKYREDCDITAVMADIHFENIFKENKVVNDVIFAFHGGEDILTSEIIKIPLKEIRVDLICKANVVVKKMIINGKTVEVDINNSIQVPGVELNEIKRIRELHGEDAVIKFSTMENKWICYCGAANKKESEKCYRCGRKMNAVQKVLAQNNGNLKTDVADLIHTLKELKSAKEIREYLIQSQDPEFVEVINILDDVVKTEKLYGNMKDEALKKVLVALS